MIAHGHTDPGSYTLEQIRLYSRAASRREHEDRKVRVYDMRNATRGSEKDWRKLSQLLDVTLEKLNKTEGDEEEEETGDDDA